MSLIVRRSNALPSPSVIFPLKSTMMMSFTSRVVPWRAIAFILLHSFHSLVGLALTVARNAGRKVLHHDEFGTPARSAPHFEFVHESAHQEKSAARRAQQVFLVERVRNARNVEPFALIDHAHRHFLVREIDGHEDLLTEVLLVAVVVRVDHALADGHPDFVDI